MSLAAALAALAATPTSIAALPPEQSEGVGAPVPFTEYEAEAAVTNGSPIGPDRRFTTLAAEASGRRAVMLRGTGRYVEFTLARPANAITVRYAVPDGPDGRGLDATLGLHVDGARIGALPVTSRYGWFYGAYPFTNRPADGKGHHFFDHARMLLGRRLSAGTKVRLQIDPGDTAPWYAIDLADFELVAPPRVQPRGFVSVTDFGADPSGARESMAAFRAAVASGASRLWVPPGRFLLPGHLELDRVELAGAGAWHSVLFGKGVGLYGRAAPQPSADVHIRDLAIIGEVDERNDAVALSGIGGAMSRSTLSDLYIQHVKVGVWLDGPMADLRISRLRVFDVTADGLNLHRGIRRAIVEDSFFRNTGDDGIAAWSSAFANSDITIRRNTVIAPVLANGIAIYGGRNVTIEGNLVADTLTQGGGLHLGNRFKAVPLSGRILVRDNLVVRGGSFDPNWRFGIGAIWLYALDVPIRADIAITRDRLVDNSEDAVSFIGPMRIDGVAIDRLTIDGGADPTIVGRGPGSVRLSRVRSTDGRDVRIQACPAFSVRITAQGSPTRREPMPC